MKRLTIIAAVAAVAVLAPALARAYGDFKIPGGGVYCGLDSLAKPYKLLCWRAKTGFVISMSPTGRAYETTSRHYKRFYEDSSPTLRVGHSRSYGNVFLCKMASDGLTCRNYRKHGWFIGRTRGWRKF